MSRETGAMSNPARLAALVRGLLQQGLAVELSVTGGSMAPFIKPHDVVTLRDRPACTIRIGDVIGIEHAERLRIHRVVGRRGRQLLTRGDAASCEDGAFDPEQIRGVVERVERRGRRVRPGLGPERRLIAALSARRLLLPLTRTCEATRQCSVQIRVAMAAWTLWSFWKWSS